MGDWMHITRMSALGPNKRWATLAMRVFILTTLFWDARESNIAIIDKTERARSSGSWARLQQNRS